MATTISYYSHAATDGNFRTLPGARDRRVGVERTAAAAGTVDFAAAPVGSVFAMVETDVNLRYTVTPASIEASGEANLPDGQPKIPGDTSVPIAAQAFTPQGPISIEAGDVFRVTFYP